MIQAVKDSSGKVIDAWVRWNRVDDFFASGPRDRHYVLDGASGELIFGDGINGLIPPIGSNNIKSQLQIWRWIGRQCGAGRDQRHQDPGSRHRSRC